MLAELKFETTSDTDILDITDDVQNFLTEKEVTNGICVLFCPGSTASISTIEFEPGAVKDFANAIERIAPRNQHYHHEQAWNDGNGYSHVRAALMKPGITVPVFAGKLTLGTWQQIVLIDFDNKPRQRKVLIQWVGA